MTQSSSWFTRENLIAAGVGAAAMGLFCALSQRGRSSSSSSSSSSPQSQQLYIITICGGGNGATVSAGLFASQGHTVNILTRKPSEWSHHITVETENTRIADAASASASSSSVGGEKNGCSPSSSSPSQPQHVGGRINIISDNAAEVIPSSDIVLICAPAFAHPALLQKVAPHAKKGAWIGTLFAQGAFDLAARYAFGGSKNLRERAVNIFGFQFIPWTCRALEYGKTAKIVDAKKVLFMAVLDTKPAVVEAGLAMMSQLFSIEVRAVPNFLNLTLVPSNQIIHTARTYGLFSKKEEGKTTDDADDDDDVFLFKSQADLPKLYADMDLRSAEVLQGLDDELQLIKRTIIDRFPMLDLDWVMPLKQKTVRCYGTSHIGDWSTLQMVFRTAKPYAPFPTTAAAVAIDKSKPAEGDNIAGYGPPVEGRTFWEDIPFGLVILKNIAQLLDLTTSTPMMDKVLLWHQKRMGVQYLDPKTNTLRMEALGETGAPFRYGFHSIEDVVEPYVELVASP